MQNFFGNETDRATIEMMMRHYRDELLRYQRATAPGKPTLADNVESLLPPQNSGQMIEEPELSQQAEPLEAKEPPCPEPPQIEPEPPEPQEIFAEPKMPPIQISAPCWRDFHTEFEKAVGAYGEFRPYERLGKYTMASFLQSPGKAVPVLARFSADISAGGAEHSRCRKGFSVKFFCEDGEYDMPGGYLPVSAGVGEELQNACCLTTRPDSITGLRSAETFWRFLLKYPQALPMALWLYSDLATIASYRLADGYSPPCLWVNKEGEKRAVRAMWLSRRRPQTLNRFEAEESAGSDPDAMSRDLFKTLESGESIQFELAVQIIEPCQFADLDFDPFDPCVIWSKERFAVERIGLLTLDRFAKNAAKELSPERFSAGNIISGIEYPEPQAGNGIETAGNQLKLIGEFEQRTIAANMAEQLKQASPDILEQVLIMLTNADLHFGQMVTDMIGGGDIP